MSHSFETKSFSLPTFCGHCKQILWGLNKQGLQCKECGKTSHFRCKSRFKPCTRSIPTRFLDDDTRENKESIEQVYFEMQKKKSQATVQQTRLTIMTPDYVQYGESAFKHVKDILVSEKFQIMLANASLNQDKPVTAFIKKQPALNPQATTVNFTRLVSRVGPVFGFRDWMMILLSWEKPLDTWLSLVSYCFVCLYPRLILFIPQLLLIYIILSNYSKRKRKPISEKADPYFTSQTEENSPEYLRNLQNIQNSMKDVSDAYDWIVAQSSYIDWSSEPQTAHILQCLVILLLITGPLALLVSLRALFLSIGISFFISQTRFSKYMIKELTPYLLQTAQRHLHSWKGWYAHMNHEPDSHTLVSVFENQIWTSDFGYIHDPISPWSKLSGFHSWSTKSQVKPPHGYRWLQEEWQVDRTGPWVDDELNVEVCVRVDKYGWVYADDPRSISMPKTRKRRWIRIYEKVK
ncbi:unnamed protein product [Rhizopus stolonifer]